MAESVLLVLVAAVAAGVTGFAGYALARRLARGGRELGTEAEQARYTTLHLATRAAENLRDPAVYVSLVFPGGVE